MYFYFLESSKVIYFWQHWKFVSPGLLTSSARCCFTWVMLFICSLIAQFV